MSWATSGHFGHGAQWQLDAALPAAPAAEGRAASVPSTKGCWREGGGLLAGHSPPKVVRLESCAPSSVGARIC